MNYKGKRMKEKEIVKQLCNVINNCNMTNNQTVNVISTFLFSLGASLEECDPSGSDEVLMRYETKKTFGNALMAQGIWMKETWTVPEKILTDEEETKGEEKDE
jgi:hypothetical protein